MFEDNPSFQADVSSWNPAKATNMERMFYNATAFGKTRPLKETVSNSPFSLLCWKLPSAQVNTQDALCGSNARFDPCCATTVQFETSCCNRFCYNMTTTCEHPYQGYGTKTMTTVLYRVI
jgi:surface protein